MGLLRQRLNEAKGLRNHEATGSGFLDGVADCIEPNQAHAGGLEPAEDGSQIRFALGMGHVYIDLLRSERGPEQSFVSRFENHTCKRQSGTWTVDSEKVCFARARRKDAIVGEKHLQRKGEPAPRREKSLNCGDSLDM